MLGRLETKRRILIVQENEPAGIGISKLLRNEGFEIANLSDGAAAINILASGFGHDYLLIDLPLPNYDGRELAIQAGDSLLRPMFY